MATYSTYNQIGQAEDVSAIISNITPQATPFTSTISKGKARGKVFEWQEDSLASPTTIAHVEGADFTDMTLTPTVMRSNLTQIFSKTIKVSATSDAIETHGRAKETAYQLSKVGAEMKRDIEHTMVGIAQDAVTGDASSTARLTGNVLGKDSGSTDCIASGAITDGGNATMTETVLNGALQSMYDNGATPEVLMIKPADATVVANFAYSSPSGATTRIRDMGSSTKIVNSVQIYVSPFGEVRVQINRLIKADKALIYQPSMWSMEILRPMTRTLLAKTGDADKHALVTEFGLKHKNYLGSELISNLT